MGRLSPDTFRLPVERMREGYYTDAYFNLTRELLIHEDRRPHVLMQVFQKQESMLGGVDEALAIIRRCAGRHRPDGSWEDGWDALEVRALSEGDRIEPRETVLTIEGDYSLFAHLETLYLGCMARRTLVMRNVNAVVRAARGKPILFFPARHDHWLVQTGDGWAAHVAGAIGVSTDAQASWWGGRGVGTVPHGLIAAYGGDTVGAATAFAERYHDAHERHGARRLRERLGRHRARGRRGARRPALGRAPGHQREPHRRRAGGRAAPRPAPRGHADARPAGARALDDAGHRHVRIVVSGGFDAAKIERFEAESTPVDAYGVGSSLLRGGNDFTADVVRVDGRAVRRSGARSARTTAWSASSTSPRSPDELGARDGPGSAWGRSWERAQALPCAIGSSWPPSRPSRSCLPPPARPRRSSPSPPASTTGARWPRGRARTPRASRTAASTPTAGTSRARWAASGPRR